MRRTELGKWSNPWAEPAPDWSRALDNLDIGVLRELLVDDSNLTVSSDVRRPYLAIARKLHVTEDTVRNRIARMRHTGLIHGWRMGINPTVFGYEAEFIWLDVNPPAAKKDVIQAIRRNPHAILVQNYFDQFIGVSLAYASREELDREIGEMRAISNSHDSTSFNTPPVPCRMRLTETDWRIVKSMRRNPRKPYGEIAVETDLSRKTVEGRAKSMIGAAALFVLPVLDLGKLEGGVIASLDVRYRPGLKRDADRQIIERYGQLLFLTHSILPEGGWFAFMVPNLAVAHEIQYWVEDLPGVEATGLRLIEEYINLLGEAFGQELRGMPLLSKGNRIR